MFEPGAASGEPTRLVAIDCPYCGETIDTVIDLSAGSFRYIEDCQVCCQPIDLAGEVDEGGELVSVTAERA
ncbi:MAG: CPXCG motif-containing cysteine-rich protein [Gammaproteobacteria bacterium]